MEEITFQLLYEKHWADVLRLARYLTADADLAADLASETFVRAWAGRERIRTETAKAYLLATVRNLAIDERRRRHMQTVPIEDGHAMTRAKGDTGMELEQAMEAVGRLPVQLRDPLVLTAVNGLSYEEAARVLDLPLATVKIRIHRARLKLTEGPEACKER
jgi:RNA polymerase sigma-70 factor, ECF subfamily